MAVANVEAAGVNLADAELMLARATLERAEAAPASPSHTEGVPDGARSTGCLDVERIATRIALERAEAELEAAAAAREVAQRLARERDAISRGAEPPARAEILAEEIEAWEHLSDAVFRRGASVAGAKQHKREVGERQAARAAEWRETDARLDALDGAFLRHDKATMRAVLQRDEAARQAGVRDAERRQRAERQLLMLDDEAGVVPPSHAVVPFVTLRAQQPGSPFKRD